MTCRRSFLKGFSKFLRLRAPNVFKLDPASSSSCSKGNAMSLEKHAESDYCKVTELAENLDCKGDGVFLLFMASQREDGVRWCPDCVKAEPIIDGFLEKCSLTKKAHLIVVDLEKS
ncbi:hypothetical protein GE061_018017 [Apolygus lucorum]|uniref:Thioredoxin domain-containing protein 17 n=1 Tax=Apolygus lucorum TaxID=248454 RepID=A0A8S9XEP7_APOLU|nr:hypothetical protein GE061_018017 [Apolygus lucorum]